MNDRDSRNRIGANPQHQLGTPSQDRFQAQSRKKTVSQSEFHAQQANILRGQSTGIAAPRGSPAVHGTRVFSQSGGMPTLSPLRPPEHGTVEEALPHTPPALQSRLDSLLDRTSINRTQVATAPSPTTLTITPSGPPPGSLLSPLPHTAATPTHPSPIARLHAQGQPSGHRRRPSGRLNDTFLSDRASGFGTYGGSLAQLTRRADAGAADKFEFLADQLLLYTEGQAPKPDVHHDSLPSTGADVPNPLVSVRAARDPGRHATPQPDLPSPFRPPPVLVPLAEERSAAFSPDGTVPPPTTIGAPAAARGQSRGGTGPLPNPHFSPLFRDVTTPIEGGLRGLVTPQSDLIEALRQGRGRAPALSSIGQAAQHGPRGADGSLGPASSPFLAPWGERGQEDGAGITTGTQVIEYYMQHGQAADVKLFYLNPGPMASSKLEGSPLWDPYDLVVVEKNEVRPEHYTITYSGVVHTVPDGEGNVMPLGDFMREMTIFRMLRRLGHFRFHVQRKYFLFWKQEVRRNRYRRNRQHIQARLFHAKPHLLSLLMQVRAHTVELEALPLVHLRDPRDILRGEGQRLYLLEEFLEENTAHREQVAQPSITEAIGKISRAIEATCEAVCAEERHVRLQVGDEAEQEAFEKSGVILIRGPQVKTQAMSSLKHQKLELIRKYRAFKEEKELLPHLIKLVDCMCSEALMEAGKTAAQQMLDLFEHFDSKLAHKGLFNSVVSFQHELGNGTLRSMPSISAFKNHSHFDMGSVGGLVLTPSKDSIVEGVFGTLEAVSELLGSSPKPLGARFLFPYMPDFERIGLDVAQMLVHDEGHQDKLHAIDRIMNESFAEADAYAQVFEDRRAVYEFITNWDAEEYEHEPRDSESVIQDLEKVKAWRSSVDYLKTNHGVGVLNLDAKQLKSIMAESTASVFASMREKLASLARLHCEDACKTLLERNKALAKRPDRLEEFSAYFLALHQYRRSKEEVMAGAHSVLELYEVLKAYEFRFDVKRDQVPLDDLKEYMAVHDTRLEEAQAHVDLHWTAMTGQLEKLVFEKDAELLQVVTELSDPALFADPSQDPAAVLQRLQVVGSRLEAIHEDFMRIGHHQEIFNFPRTQNINLESAMRDFHMRKNLWESMDHFEEMVQHWVQEAAVADLHLDEITEFLGDQLKQSYRLARMYKEDPVAARLGEEVESFKEFEALLTDVASPALQLNHWQLIFDAMNVPMPEGGPSSFTFRDLLMWGLEDHAEEVENITALAQREYTMLSGLREMKGELDKMTFDIIPYKDQPNMWVVSHVDEVQQVMDDQLLKLQAMAASPFVHGIKEDLRAWESTLAALQELIDEWAKCQSHWMYLEPIFSSDDIMKQMPDEGEKFLRVDQALKEMMQGVVENPHCLTLSKNVEMIETLIANNVLLDSCLKGLDAYLEKKRLAFPRFFFLSNEEILEILSETREPQRVQPHLKKCFEGIERLGFQYIEWDKDQAVHSMVSAEGEEVKFLRQVSTKKARGAVEKWLVQVEDAMFEAVHAVTAEALADYPQRPRSEWVLSWPGMSALAVSSLYWTAAVEKAIQEHDLQGVYEACDSDLMDIVQRVRGELTPLERITLGTLVVQDVHARDVVQALVDARVADLNDFNWKSQLRVYWEQREMQDGTKRKRQSLVLRMMMAEIEYGYEYLGNTTRLVITPLTDRCYRTLMMAYHVNLGGSPEGPAGTGKTETTKDLAKAVARQCLVFNCSDSLDYIAMGKFFKGLAASGAWACLDEFNRIDLEVLSVAAQQIMSIQMAIAQRLVTFTFEGTELQLKWTSWVGVTMNPAYAGRNELPDNLKARFRVVAMMVPDYAMIAEIILFSEGYAKARECATKIVQCYKLCSEQLSSQDWYDNGMHAVIAVLRAAGQLKRLHPGEEEFSLVLKSIIDVNLCKFVADDIPLFMGVVSDLFPGVRPLNVFRADLIVALETVCHEAGLQPTHTFKNKALQLYDMVQVRHGLMAVGLPYAGKSSVCTMLARALTLMNKLGKPEHKVRMHVVNPKSVDAGRLFGEYEALSHEWTDGILAVHFRKAANQWPEVTDRHWIVLDGPVDAIWIENMNTVLDDNKKLCLNSGEIIKMSPHMTMMFEVADLSQASPATVSRCGMVYLDPTLLGWKPLVYSWMERACTRVPMDGKLYLIALFDNTLPVTIAFCRHEIKTVIPYVDSQVVAQLCRNLDALASSLLQDQSFWVSSPDTLQSQLQSVFVMALVWSFGVLAADDESRREFDKFLRALLNGRLDEYVAPSGTIYRPENYPAPALQLEESENALQSSSPNLPSTGLPVPVPMPAAERSRTSNPGGEGLQLEKSGSTIQRERSMSEKLSHGISSRNSMIRHSGSLYMRNALGRTNTIRSRAISMHDGSSAFMFVVNLPTDARRSTCFDFCWDYVKGAWKKWDMMTPGETPPSDVSFKDIVVPTPDRTRYMYFLDLAIKNSLPTLFVGPTGVGKSRYIEDFLFRLDQNRFSPPNLLSLSARTTALSTQRLVDARLDRRRKGVYGPPPGRQQVIFVDDLNMPKPEKFGAQPPLELLRQFLDQGGWYQVHDNVFREIVDCILVAAMGPTGGGRYPVTMRLTRHFQVLGMTDMEPITLRHIYQTLLGWHLTRHDFPEEIKSMNEIVVEATISVYNKVVGSLMPTPSKMFYLFNIRDVSRVFHAMTLMLPSELPAELGSVRPGFLRLWVHEIMRVFGDRLVDLNDRDVLLGNVRHALKAFFHLDLEKLLEPVMARNRGVMDVGLGTAIGPQQIRQLVFADFLFDPNPATGAPPYREIDSLVGTIMPRLEQTLHDYNTVSKQPMNLALFFNAVEHVTRICRALRLPGEHLLLIGVGGSGRQSLSRLATYIMGYDLFTVEVTSTYQLKDWRDDLKKIVLRAGLDGEPCVLLLSDAQLTNEAFIEDLNSLLNSGDVPMLFTLEEKNEIAEAVRRNIITTGGTITQLFAPKAQSQLNRAGLSRMGSTRAIASPIERRASSRALARQMSAHPAAADGGRSTVSRRSSIPKDGAAEGEGPSADENVGLPAAEKNTQQLTNHELQAYFVRKTAEKLHVVLCMSPVGAKFRERLRNFPSLINCCTIDTFDEWGEEALLAVGTQLMKDVPIADDLHEDVVDIAVQCHLDSQYVSKEFLKQTGRPSYVTPINYTELFTLYRSLLERKTDEADQLVTRLTRGIEKIDYGASQIETMRQELMDLKPKLERTTQETQDLLDILNADKVEVDEKRRMVDDEVQIANQAASEAHAIRRECEDRLAQAMPAMESAIRALDTIKPSDIRIIQSFKNPPKVIKLIIESVVVLLDIPPVVMPDPTNNLKRIVDYWQPALRMLIDPHFLDKLKSYDKDNIPAKIMRQITQEYTCQEDFDYDKAARASSAAEGICRWVLALVTYDKVAKEIAPKRAALSAAEKVYNEKMAGLASKQAELDALLRKLKVLEDRLAAMERKKAELEAEIESVKVKLERAERLMGGLGGEMDRWAQSRTEMMEKMPHLIGDMLLAAAAISYLGPYTRDFRRSTLDKWFLDCEARDLPLSVNFSLERALGNPVELQHWEVCGLPNDAYSIENGLMAMFCKRHALCVDPQKQAANWIRNVGKRSNLKAMRVSDPLLMRNLEAAMQYGIPVLIEEVGLELDAGLDPVLRMQTFQSGGMTCIRLGEAAIELHPNFRLYMTSVLRNPNFVPELWSKVTVINFTITREGLAEQLLGVLVKNERPELEEQRLGLVQASAENKRQLVTIEDEILRVLSESQGNILDDEKAIEVISAAKAVSEDIKAKQKLSEATQTEVERTRNMYRPCGDTASVLYQCVSDLARLDHMYQFSLAWFTGLFERSMEEKVPKEAGNLNLRLEGIERRFTTSLFNSVAQSLFRKDKALLALMIAVHLETLHHKISQAELQYLLLGPQFRATINMGPSRSSSTVSAGNSRRGKRSLSRLDLEVPLRQMGAESFRQGPLPTFTVPEEQEEEMAGEGDGPKPTRSLRANMRIDTDEAVQRRKSITQGALALQTMKSVTAMHLANPPVGQWPTAQVWEEIVLLSEAHEALHSLPSEVRKKADEWQVYAESSGPEMRLPPEPFDVPDLTASRRRSSAATGYESIYAASSETQPSSPSGQGMDLRPVKLTMFQHLLILRAIRKDRLPACAELYVTRTLGKAFVEPQPIELRKIMNMSDYLTPVLFILTPGFDPGQALQDLAVEQHMKGRLYTVALGQGQGAVAEKVLEREIKDGGWVLLENCHLATSWMHRLEKIIDGMDPEHVNHTFRLWLSSQSTPHFPAPILERCIKVTNEAPPGLKSSLLRSLASDPMAVPHFSDDSQHPRELKRLLFGLCFVHAFVQERKNYGPIGWNIPYMFADGDLRISAQHVRLYVSEGQGLNGDFTAIRYTIGEINYGGRVTDEQDRRLMRTLLTAAFPEDCLTSISYGLLGPESPLQIGAAPLKGGMSFAREMLETITLSNGPEMFGLHSNADIQRQILEAQEMLEKTVRMTTGAGQDATPAEMAEGTVVQTLRGVLSILPPDFEVRKVARYYPVSYENSMNQILLQELVRYNGLLGVIRDSLQQLDRAIQGLVVMSDQLEGVFGSLRVGTVPELWKAKSYPTTRSLGSYVQDLILRCEMFSFWIEHGQPVAFWLPGFFFTHAFFTATLQNYARKFKVPIDEITFEHKALVMPMAWGLDVSTQRMNQTLRGGSQSIKSDVTDLFRVTTPDVSHPDTGVYVYGMHMEGCAWDSLTKHLVDPRPMQLYSTAPVFWFRPVIRSEGTGQHVYSCPVYKTPLRRGVLSTTGHSSSHVCNVSVPIHPDQTPETWVLRGAAMLLEAP